MEGRRVLRSLKLRNILSFGAEEQSLELQPLNVLIGPNASGKSNLIEILTLLRSLPNRDLAGGNGPKDLPTLVSESGGMREWLWKGPDATDHAYVGSEWELDSGKLVSHEIAIGQTREKKLEVFGETIGEGFSALLHYHYSKPETPRGRFFNLPEDSPPGQLDATLTRPPDFRRDYSILAQVRDSRNFPDVAGLQDQLSGMRFYCNWEFGRSSPARSPRPIANRDDYLAEDDSANLALVLKRVLRGHAARERIHETLQNAHEDFRGIRLRKLGDHIQLLFAEGESYDIPAGRLSDGTLRLLQLLVILCDPHLGSLVCIEEPELGLHPDLVPTIARLLLDASRRTQLVVTTHSAELVSALGDTSEAVIVCERSQSGTTLRRLDPSLMEVWLKKYSLGELWLSGEIGGTRW